MASRAIPFRRPILRLEEAAGLVVAVAVHVALGFWLAHQRPDPPLPAPERMTVTFSDEVAEQSTAPKPADEAPPAAAPAIADMPAPEPAPRPVPQPAPPQPRAALPRPEPARVQPAKPEPAKIQPPKPQALKSQPPKPLPPKPQAAKPAPDRGAQPVPAPAKPAPPRKPPGRNPFDEAFQKAPGEVSKPAPRNPGLSKPDSAPAQTIGPAVKSALSGAIARQLKPKWSAPQGAEADQLVTVLSWELNPDGTLAGPPRLVSQTGVTDANRPQAQRHVEQAMRAVRLAAPFDLPPDLYPAWKRVGQFRFDRKLSQ